MATLPTILGNMLDLISVGDRIAEHRRTLKLSQAELARKAGANRATLDALENRHTGERRRR